MRQGDVKPSDLALYLEHANSVMFNSEVIGAEVYNQQMVVQLGRKHIKDI